MQRYIIMTALFAALIARADLVPRIAWQVDLEDPRTKKIELLYGETVDLQCMFRNYFSPLDISGAAVTLHARTNGMAASESFQVLGSAQPGGIATVRVAVDAWLPQGLETVDYTLAVVQTNSVNVLRAYGSIYLRGSTAASVNAPVPVSVFSQINAALSNHISIAAADMLVLSNNLMAAMALPGSATNLVSADGLSAVYIAGGKATLLSQTASHYKLSGELDDNGLGVYNSFLVGPPSALPLYIPINQSGSMTHAVLTGPDSTGWVWTIDISSYGTAYTVIRSSGPDGISCGAWLSFLSPIGWPDVLYPQEGAYGKIRISRVSAPVILATQIYVDQALDNFSPPFQNLLLYSAGGTNYYPRWSATQNTFIVTGVPQ